MKKPDFFIIGAPKCGTTALAAYLSDHPNVYMCNPKEPHHYNTDIAYGLFKDRAKYLGLFESVSREHIVVGEASVWYLYSKEAVLNILSESPEAKFIVMLRNPIEMAPSLHEQMVFSGFETETDFKLAWEMQDARKHGQKVPPWCSDSKLLLYKSACSLGEQFERVKQQIPNGNLLPILFDDLKARPREVWLDVMDFLSLSDDGRNVFPVINPAKERRSTLLKKINDIYYFTREKIRFQGFGTGFFKVLDRWNIKQRERKTLSMEMRNTLIEQFSKDIELLEKNLERDLSAWRKS